MGKRSFRNRFTSLLDAVDLVTFDIFDTALLRGVARPTDLFLQVEVEARARGAWPPLKTKISDFPQARLAAELDARNHAWASAGWVEVRLEEIYASLARAHGLDENTVQTLMEIEEKVEMAHGFRNRFVGGLYDQARCAGKRVGFISDMYLDEGMVGRLLTQAGYTNFDFLLVSSASRETKSAGLLFNKVLQSEVASPERWLHVGDNPDADVKRARMLGIRTLHYPKCMERIKSHRVLYERVMPKSNPGDDVSLDPLFQSTVAGLVAAHNFSSANSDHSEVRSKWTAWDDWGYQHVGPLLTGFGNWLAREIKRKGFRDVYFLARDGYLIKDVFDRVMRSAYRSDVPAGSHYLYGSRRAFNFGSIVEMDEESIDFLVSGTSRLTPRQFLARIDINIDDALDVVERIGFPSPDVIVDGGLAYGRLRALLRELGPLVLTRAAGEREALEQYFQDMHLLNGGRVAVVDLGWHGTLQNAMRGLLKRMGSSTELVGYYLGTFPAARRYTERGQEMYGYLCEEGRPAHLHEAIRTSVELFEWVFSAPHGSVSRLRLGAHGVEPVLSDFPFEAERWKLASAVQKGALQFVEDYLSLWRGQGVPEVPPASALHMFHSALSSPTAWEANCLGNLQHAEGFGGVAIPRYIAKPSGSLWNPVSYPSLIRGYRTAFWRKGYVKSLLSRHPK